jgi:hypothetical protein
LKVALEGDFTGIRSRRRAPEEPDDVLAHQRGVVAVNRPCAEAQPLLSEPIRSPMLLTRWTTLKPSKI